MILPDSSIWIDFFNGQETPKTELLEELLANNRVLVGDLILTEVLQGFRHNNEFQRASDLLTCLPFRAMLGQKVALQSAQNYRFLRQRGITIRNTIDVMIATFCIVNEMTLLQNDRDFAPMIEHLDLIVL